MSDRTWRRWLTAALVPVVVACAAADSETPVDADVNTTQPDAADDPEIAKHTRPDGELARRPEAPAAAVGLALDIGGRGDRGANDLAAAGLDAVSEGLSLITREVEPEASGVDRTERVAELGEWGADVAIAVGMLFDDAVATAAIRHPDTHFVLLDGFLPDLRLDGNILAVTFADHEGAFLAGAAAALTSSTGHIGFMGGVRIPLTERFEAGFVAGARHIDPQIEIDRRYLTEPPDFTGFTDPDRAREVATSMFESGVDVILHAAEGSGAGVFDAAAVFDVPGRQVWAIGSGIDQSNAVADDNDRILTSIVRRLDVAVAHAVRAHVDDDLVGGYLELGVGDDALALARTRGHLDGLIEDIDVLRDAIADGTIVVPEIP